MRLGRPELYNPQVFFHAERHQARWAYFKVLMGFHPEAEHALKALIPVWQETYLRAAEAFEERMGWTSSIDRTAPNMAQNMLITCLHTWAGSGNLDDIELAYQPAFGDLRRALFLWRRSLSWMPPLESPEREDLLVFPATYALWIWLCDGLDKSLQDIHDYTPCALQVPLALP